MGFIKNIKTSLEVGKQQGEAIAAIRRKESGCAMTDDFMLSLSGLVQSFDAGRVKLSGLAAMDSRASDVFAEYFSSNEVTLEQEVANCQTMIRETGCMAQLSVVAAEAGRQVVVNCVCPNYQRP